MDFTTFANVSFWSSRIDPLLSVPRAAEHSPIWRDRARLIRQALESGSAFVSDVSADAVSREAHASIETPVLRDGDPIYEIALVFSLTEFAGLLEGQRLPEGWLSGIVDRNGLFVARSPAQTKLPGTPASLEFRNAARNPTDGIVSHNSAEGRPILSAYSATPNGWTVGVAAQVDRFAVGPSAFLLTAMLAGLALAGSLVLSFLNSRRLARQMRELQTKAEQVFAGRQSPRSRWAFASLTTCRRRCSKLRNCWLSERIGNGAPRRICARAKSTFASWPTACRNSSGRRGPMAASNTPTLGTKGTGQPN